MAVFGLDATTLMILVGSIVLLVLVVMILVVVFKKKKFQPDKSDKGQTQSVPRPVVGKDEPLFKIDVNVGIPTLPDVADPTKLVIKYPLMPPYTFAHVHWDAANTELVYDVEEPVLSEQEKDILKVLEDGIRELINLSYINTNNRDTVLLYLEKNMKILLTELAIDLSMDSYLKIMYYIYRDFVGLNELEPMMNDYFIEDVECNGVNSPLYVVHRKYRNIRTSLVYKDIHGLASFVEKLAQKCGKYVSYAEPLLDGSMPDGSRLNATYSTDVSSKGPTYTLRKFTKEPWSPLQLVQKGTVTAEILAYLWMLIEYENSFMVVGGTGTGKCVVGSTPVYLANGRIKSIKEIIESKFRKG